MRKPEVQIGNSGFAVTRNGYHEQKTREFPGRDAVCTSVQW
jgi:hypothetical protein